MRLTWEVMVACMNAPIVAKCDQLYVLEAQLSVSRTRAPFKLLEIKAPSNA